MKEEQQIQETELFMLAQFIEIIEILEKYQTIEEIKKDIRKRKQIYLEEINKKDNYRNFWLLSLNNETINQKIEKGRKLYITSRTYKNLLKKLDKKSENLIKCTNKKNELDRIKEIIYEICDLDINLAYKLGLIDGLKINVLK